MTSTRGRPTRDLKPVAFTARVCRITASGPSAIRANWSASAASFPSNRRIFIVPRYHTQRLHGGSRRHFRIRQDREGGNGTLRELPERRPYPRRAEGERLMSGGHHSFCLFPHSLDQLLLRRRIERQLETGFRTPEAVGDGLLHDRVDGEAVEAPVALRVVLRQAA